MLEFNAPSLNLNSHKVFALHQQGARRSHSASSKPSDSADLSSRTCRKSSRTFCPPLVVRGLARHSQRRLQLPAPSQQRSAITSPCDPAPGSQNSPSGLEGSEIKPHQTRLSRSMAGCGAAVDGVLFRSVRRLGTTTDSPEGLGASLNPEM